MRQGLDEMLQFDKKSEEKMRVYTYEDAVKRFYTFLFMSFKKKDTELNSKKAFYFFQAVGCKPICV